MTQGGDIAIIGMSGRFPGAADLAEFWANIRDGVESVTRFDEQHLRSAGVSPAESARPDYVPAGAPLDGIDLFDADFFGYTAREAQIMDPQHRLFLETAWEALEHAGYDATRHDGAIGVFGGAGSNGYLRNIYSNPDVVANQGGTQILIGNELGFLTTRVSYKLDLRGPSVALRSACSTSLVAVHVASQSLRAGECDTALAGGVFVNLQQDQGYRFQEGSFLAPDGHCRPFDAGAHGTIFGSGVGVVVLKRLTDAIAAGDTVHAVIKGSAINNDGAVKVGFTAPGVDGQAAVIASAMAAAGVDARSIRYVEAHGTGTVLGDPIELRALTKAYRRSTGDAGFCALGSLKGNIGHLDAAAGVAGLIKVVLALGHETVPPSLNFTAPNPAIDFDGSPFRVQTAAAPWHAPRRAGVSAFGFGGTNAHLIVEQAPESEPEHRSRRTSQLLLLSARTPEALEAATDRLATRLGHDCPPLADVAYTLATGRHVFAHRRIVTGGDAATIAAGLTERDPARVVTKQTTKQSPGVAFLLSGQGSPFPGMARELYDQEPVFHAAVDECAEILGPLPTGDLREWLLRPGTSSDDPHRTDLAQPAVFVMQYALVRLWRAWGIVPRYLLGHSLGEYVAACVSGVFTLADALRLVRLRGRLMQRQPAGSMVSVVADRETVNSLLSSELSLAAHNGPQDCVVAGDDDAITAFVRQAQSRGLVVRPVATSHAFHSALMEPMIDEFVAAVAATARHAPSIPFVSNVTGTWITDEQARSPQYWGRHIRAGVEFAAGVHLLAEDPDVVLLEVGPGQTLSSLARRVLTGASGRVILSTLSHRSDPRGALQAAQRALGQLWLAGVVPDWTGYYHGERRRRVPLPTYPLQRGRYWLESGTPAAISAGTAATGRRRDDLADWFHVPSWERAAPMPADAAVPDGHWLILADHCGLSDALAARLREAGRTVTTVTAGPEWSKVDNETYVVDPARADDYARLIGEAMPEHIVHCWTVTPAVPEQPPDVETSLRQGFGSLLELAKAVTRHNDAIRRTMWVISNGLHDVIGEEPLDPLKALLLGPCRVIPREHPDLACRSIDVDLAGSPTPEHVEKLIREFATDSAERTVAHRGRHRWVQRYLPMPMPEPAGGTPIRAGGVYLITGGLGGLGLALAEHLAAMGTKLVLVGRTALPPEQHWTDRRPGDEKIASVIEKLIRIRRTGAQVMLARADVGDLDQMSAVVGQAVDRWGAVHGVFHAAGLAGGGLIQLKTMTAATDVLRPKVHGTLALERAVAHLALDFMVLFGSNAANVGDFGLVDYCAANSFLDAFAHSRARHRRVVAIDWGPWQSVGMAVATDVPTGLDTVRQQDVAERGMRPAEGLEALGRILQAGPVPQVIVSPVDISVLLANAFTLPTRADDRLAGLASAGTGHPRPAIDTTYMSPTSDTQRRMCEAWQDILGIEQVGVHDSFFDLGGNSLIAIQLTGALNQATGARLTVADLYEALTISQLATIVDGTQDDAVGTESSLAQRRQRAQKRREHQQQQRRRMTRPRT